MKCVLQVGTVTVENTDTDDEGKHDTADDELSGSDADDHPSPRPMEMVLRIIEAGSPLDVIVRLSIDERLLASVETSVDPDEPARTRSSCCRGRSTGSSRWSAT